MTDDVEVLVHDFISDHKDITRDNKTVDAYVKLKDRPSYYVKFMRKLRGAFEKQLLSPLGSLAVKLATDSGDNEQKIEEVDKQIKLIQLMRSNMDRLSNNIERDLIFEKNQNKLSQLKLGSGLNQVAKQLKLFDRAVIPMSQKLLEDEPLTRKESRERDRQEEAERQAKEFTKHRRKLPRRTNVKDFAIIKNMPVLFASKSFIDVERLDGYKKTVDQYLPIATKQYAVYKSQSVLAINNDWGMYKKFKREQGDDPNDFAKWMVSVLKDAGLKLEFVLEDPADYSGDSFTYYWVKGKHQKVEFPREARNIKWGFPFQKRVPRWK